MTVPVEAARRSSLTGRTHGDALVNAVFAGAVCGLLAVIALTGLGRAMESGGTWAQATHHVAAGALLVVLIAGVAFAYARAVYRARPVAWLATMGLLMLVLTSHATGAGLVPGAHGAEARAHVAVLIGITPSVLVLLVAHALLVVPAVAVVILLFRSTPLVRRVAAASGAAAAAVAAVLGRVVPARPYVPEVVGATAARAPWELRALEPLETLLGIPVAFTLAGATLALVTLLPLIDRGSRPPWLRPVVTVTLTLVVTAYALLAVWSAFETPDHT